MIELHEEFERRARLAADERLRVDLDDQQRELSGLEAGRMPRFLTAATREARSDRSKGSDKSGDGLSRLQQLLMNDPAYAALYEDTFDKLRAAEAATDEALTRALEMRTKAQDQLDATLASAAVPPDGTRVFRDNDGTVWSEHGERVTGAESEAIAWPEDAPSYESYLAHSQAVAQADQRTEALRGYQVDVLGNIRERMTNEDDPPTAEELREIQSEIDAQMPDLSGSADLDADNGPQTQPVAEIEIPKL